MRTPKEAFEQLNGWPLSTKLLRRKYNSGILEIIEGKLSFWKQIHKMAVVEYEIARTPESGSTFNVL